jgi:hypothetical protein
MMQYGVDAVVVQLETPDGEPDDTAETAAASILDDLPVAISFGAPFVTRSSGQNQSELVGS